MNPHHNSNQDPTIASILQQVNSLIYQQTYNGSVVGLYPNNRPIDAPSSFMNFSNQPIPLQSPTDQFPNGIGRFNPQHNCNPFPPNQFNSSQQQGQFFANNSMNHPVYNQNVGRPLQLQNPNYAQYPPGNFPMFQIHNKNTTSHQNPGFPASQQFGMSNFSRSSFEHGNQGQQRFHSPMMDGNLPNMGQQLQGNQFQPNASVSVLTQKSHNFHATPNNLQNHISQGVGPQSHNFPMNGTIHHGNQGQQRFVSQQGSLYSPHASTLVQAHNPSPTITNFKDKKGTLSQPKNFTGNKKNHTSRKGYKSPFQHAKHVKNGNMNKEGKSNASVNSHPQNSTNFKIKKVRSFNYTDEEIKQWHEDRKKNYPTSVKKSKEEKISMLRCKELKKILVKQAELGCGVADIPSCYLSGLSTPEMKELHAKQAQLACEVADLSILLPKRPHLKGQVRICTINVGTLNDKLLKLTNTLRKRKVDIACIQKTKWKGEEATLECNGYNLWHAGLENAINGVGILISTNLKDNVVEVKRCCDRIIAIKVAVERKMVNVVCVYAPHATLEDSIKRSFWESLDDIVKGIPINECIFLGGDFNGHIGKKADGYETVHGGFGFGTRNDEGHRLLEFATAHDLVVANSFYKKRDAHLITFHNEGYNSQNDYLLLRKWDRKACIDCKALPGETSASQHKLLVMDLYMSMRKRIVRHVNVLNYSSENCFAFRCN